MPKKKMKGGMMRLPPEALQEISNFVEQRPPRQQLLTEGRLALERGLREPHLVRARNTRNLNVMNAGRRTVLQEANDYLRQDPETILEDLQNPDPNEQMPVLQLRQMYMMTGRPIPYQLLVAFPMIGQGIKKIKGGVIPVRTDQQLESLQDQGQQQGARNFQEIEEYVIERENYRQFARLPITEQIETIEEEDISFDLLQEIYRVANKPIPYDLVLFYSR